MKRFRITVILIAAVLLLIPAASHADDGYDGDQIILSWTDDSAHTQTITWHSKSREDGYVQYNREGAQLSPQHQVKAKIIEVRKDYYRYEASIKGLSQKTTYEYRVGDGDRWSKIRTFTTAPVAEHSRVTASDDAESFEFLYLGDVQYKKRSEDYKAWGKMIQDIRQRNPGIAFSLMGGDMVNSPRNMNDWNLFLSQATSVFAGIPMMTTIGNHETTVRADLYLKMLALPQNGPKGEEEEFYSFDYGNCHIAVVNTSFFLDNRKAAMEEEWDRELDSINGWLEEDLTRSSSRWKLVVMHHPAYGISDGDPIYDAIREEWEPVFERGGVDLVLCGHQHLYMRTKEIGDITYVMGNSGKRRSTYFNGENVPEYTESLNATDSNYQIIKVTEDKLTLESYDEEGQIIDKWTKSKAVSPIWKAAAAAGIIILVAAAAVAIRLRLRKRR
ncbi:metallophosphoesterase family protein [Anaerovorax odorimutans]|uniref:Metallophosphoesterase family protein n=1 Tax=Anaerovorax odorimutans TaxID=109327 RepID=A0ABT1RPS5_9FIRM|nr:metallophosphoesterase family protein [Anaerovorax odorimutans]MCQ4636881.1 metallophosphoesterase family protein [Anaerovorax odorimutans]